MHYPYCHESICPVLRKESFAAKMALSIMPNGIENKSFTEKHLDFVVAPILRR